MASALAAPATAASSSKPLVKKHRVSADGVAAVSGVPPHITVPHVPSRLSTAFSASTSLSSAVLLTLSEPDALSMAVHLSTSSHLSHRYHTAHHLLIPLARRWAHKLHAPSADESATAEESAQQVEALQQYLATTIAVIVTALPTWLDAASRLYMRDLIQAVTASIPSSTLLLLSSLHGLIAASNRAASLLRYEKAILVIADAVPLTLAQLTDEERTKAEAVVVPVVTGTLLMMDRALEGQRAKAKYSGRATRVVRRILHYHPTLAGTILTATATASTLRVMAVVLACLPAEAVRGHLKPLLALYEQAILSSKDAAFIAEHATAFASVLPLVSDAELSSVLMVTVERMGKRNPELILPSLTAMLSALSVDLSAYHKQLLPLLLSELRHGEEDRRKTALSVLTALVRKTKDEAALTSLLGALLAHLQGKSGVLSQWQLRASFLSAIGSLSQSERLPLAHSAALSASALDAAVRRVGQGGVLGGARCWRRGPHCSPAESVRGVG